MGACESKNNSAAAANAGVHGMEEATKVGFGEGPGQAIGAPLWQQCVEQQNAAEAEAAAKQAEADAAAKEAAGDDPQLSEEAAKQEEEAKNAEAAAKKEEEDAAAKKEAAAKKKADAAKLKKRAASPKKAAAKAVADKKDEAKAEEKKVEEPAGEAVAADAPLDKMAIREREKAFKAKPAKEQTQLGEQIRKAAKANDAAGVKTLLDSGAVPSVTDKDGWTPLMVAAEQGGTETCQLLLQYGADPKAVLKLGEYGMTALHFAARKGHLDTAKVLVKVSDLSLKNHQGRTAKEVAKAEGHDNIAKICKK